ncbi:NUDIX hydrolase [Compostibacter hankyongensis]|uniref:GDP-mannose pyrophosphatase n=1 Tax=Compostibacter hankyongensis TaxID=1007089 RepID=A0ABP8FPH0_9BACT
MQDKDTINPWQVLGSRQQYDNPWITVAEHQVINPGGGRGIYGTVHFKNRAIGIVAMDDQGHIFLVGQYRFPLERYSWEIPEGGGPLEEADPLESAKRELLEETGLKAARWDRLLELHLSNSVSDEYGLIYLARELTRHQAQPEETEQLTLKRLPFSAAYRMLEEGEITDSLTVSALLKVKIMILEGQLL